MKKFKRIMALVIALAMVLTMMSMTAWADPSTTNNVTPDKQVTISGLSAGDTVSYYQVIEWKTNTGWAFTNDFSDLETGGLSGGYVIGATDTEKLTRPTEFPINVLNYITGLPAGYKVNSDGTGIEEDSTKPLVYGRINSLLAAKIAEIAKSKGTAVWTDTNISGTSSVYKDADTATDGDQPIAPGLYLALIDAGETGVMYNPIFVSADYSQTEITGEGDTEFNNAWAVTTEDSYSDEAVAKKSKITVNKEVTDSDTNPAAAIDDQKSAATADAGEILGFKISTQMPEFANNYTWAKFTVTDSLTNGIKTVLDADHPLTIKVGNATPYTFTSAAQIAAADTEVFKTLTFTNEGESIVVDFASAFILAQDDERPIEITYSAKVTADAVAHNVDETKNEVKVEFSNNPGDESGYGTIKDVTTHYTFSLDADLMGEESGKYITSELIKVGVDRDGNWINESKLEEYDNGSKAYPLGGAEFGLFTSSEKATAAVGKNMSDLTASADAATAAGLYINDIYPKGAMLSTSDVGKLNFQGLDAGTYYLVETKAPDGFIADTTVKTITITPTYKEVEVKENIDGIVITYKAKVLDKYEVDVNGVKSTYTMDYGTPTYVQVEQVKNPEVDEDGDGNPDTEMVNSEVAQSGTAIQAFTLKDSTSKDIEAGTWINGKKAEDIEDLGTAADNSTFLANTQGTELPSTGGIGTTIFYVVGAFLVIGAGVILITRRRMDA